MHRQQLLRVRGETLNEMLNRGARVVWIRPTEDGQYEVVLETMKEPEINPREVVVDFISNIDPRDLEHEVAQRDMDVQLGEAVMLYLAGMVADGPA